MSELEEKMKEAMQEASGKPRVLSIPPEIIPAGESVERLHGVFSVVYSSRTQNYSSGEYPNKHALPNFFAAMNFFPEDHPKGLYGTCHRGSKAITIANHTRGDIREREKTKMHELLHAITGMPDDYAITQLEQAVVGEGWPKDRYERGVDYH